MSRYVRDAEDYEVYSHAGQRWAGELIGRSSLDGIEDVLDRGCGDEEVAAELEVVSPGSLEPRWR